MFFLLILTRAFIPDDVITIITGSSFALNPTMYIPFKRIGIYKSIIENFNFGLSNQLLDPLGFKSDSIVYSNASSFILILIVLTLHSFIYLFSKLLSRWKSDGAWSWLIKITIRIVKKFYEILTYGYYIRFLLELNQMLLISSNNEIYLFKTSSGLKIISLIISLIGLLLCLVIIFIPIYLTFSSYKLDENEHNKLEDFFVGLKPQKRFKFHSALLLIRRLIFVVFLIFFVSINSKILILVLSIFQIIYLISITILRPFKELKTNLIEIMNEVYFFLLFGSLFILNTEKDWNINITFIYMWVLASNSMSIFTIILSKYPRIIFSRHDQNVSYLDLQKISWDPTSNNIKNRNYILIYFY